MSRQSRHILSLVRFHDRQLFTIHLSLLKFNKTKRIPVLYFITTRYASYIGVVVKKDGGTRSLFQLQDSVPDAAFLKSYYFIGHLSRQDLAKVVARDAAVSCKTKT